MKIFFKINSLEQEQQRIEATKKKISWYKEKGYALVLPKKALAEEYNLNDYENRIELIKKDWQKIEKDFFEQVKKIFGYDLGDIEVYFTKYGVGGSYDLPNKIIINISDEYKRFFNCKNIAHETIHLFLEPSVQKYEIEHWQKERVVDLIASKIISGYNMQKIPDDIGSVDESFTKFFPNIEKVLKNIKKSELEIKFLIDSKSVSKIREEILEIPEIFYEGRAYEKTTMLDNKGKTMDKVGARLRVRQISRQKGEKDSKVEFSYKRRLKADGGIKEEEEVETAFTTDIDSFFQILNKMGYKTTTSYERYRETYKTKDVKITLDEFPFGYILEIEGREENINEICNLLKLKKKKSYALSCDDVYVELCKKENIKPKDHILFNDSEMPQTDRQGIKLRRS